MKIISCRWALPVIIIVFILPSIDPMSAKDYSAKVENWRITFSSDETLYTESVLNDSFDTIWIKKYPDSFVKSGGLELFTYDDPIPYGKESLRGWMSLFFSSFNKTPVLSDYSIDGKDALMAEGWYAPLGQIVFGAIYPLDLNSYGSAQKVAAFISSLDQKTTLEILDSLHVEYVEPQTTQASAITHNLVVPNGAQGTTQSSPATGRVEPYVLIKCKGTLYNKLGAYAEAGVGKVYLVTNLEIENHGYDDFSVNPNYAKVEIDNVLYDYTWLSYNLKDLGLPSLGTVTLMNGGKTSGAIAFEIPRNTQQYRLIWSSRSNYNVYVENT